MIWINSLDQVYPVVDGGPVQERYVFFVWLPNIETCLHQLPAALEDAVPKAEGGGLKYVQMPDIQMHKHKQTQREIHKTKRCWENLHTKLENKKKQTPKQDTHTVA